MLTESSQCSSCVTTVKMFPILIIFTFQIVTPQDISSIVDVKTLSELPLERLLQVKSTFKEPEVEKTKYVGEAQPEALALQGNRKYTDRGGSGGGYHVHYEENNSKKSGKKSVQSIFQASVTALAFLAFGGYLLCLLIQAVKSKTTIMTMTTTTTTEATAAFFRPRPTRKRKRPTRRPVKLQRPVRPYMTRPREKREIWPEADPESMYYALIHLSEAYANYHTIDYRKFNYTVSSYDN